MTKELVGSTSVGPLFVELFWQLIVLQVEFFSCGIGGLWKRLTWILVDSVSLVCFGMQTKIDMEFAY